MILDSWIHLFSVQLAMIIELYFVQVARRGARVGVPAPMLVQMERQIDREIAADKKYAEFSQGTDFNDGDDTDLSDTEDLTEYAPLPQIVTNDLKSLDEMVSTVIEIFNG